MSFEDRRTIKTPLPPTDEEQAAFDAWKAEYERLEQVGLDNQWLDGGWGDPYYPGSPRPSGYEEHEETDEEYERRMKDPWARLSYMFSRSVLDHFIENESGDLEGYCRGCGDPASKHEGSFCTAHYSGDPS